MIVYEIAFAIFFIVPVLWVMFKMAKWSAPLSFIAGLAVLVIGTHLDKIRMMTFGVGLMVFSALLFTANGASRGR